MGKDPDELLTPSVAAELLHLSVDQVRNLADNGTLPVQLTSTGRRLFKRVDVDDLVFRRSLMPRRRRRAA